MGAETKWNARNLVAPSAYIENPVFTGGESHRLAYPPCQNAVKVIEKGHAPTATRETQTHRLTT